jgi:hypothetical protein
MIKLLFIQFSPISSYVPSHKSKYSPLQPVLKHPEIVFVYSTYFNQTKTKIKLTNSSSLGHAVA